MYYYNAVLFSANCIKLIQFYIQCDIIFNRGSTDRIKLIDYVNPVRELRENDQKESKNSCDNHIIERGEIIMKRKWIAMILSAGLFFSAIPAQALAAAAEFTDLPSETWAVDAAHSARDFG